MVRDIWRLKELRERHGKLRVKCKSSDKLSPLTKCVVPFHKDKPNFVRQSKESPGTSPDQTPSEDHQTELCDALELLA
jgi:hypothetical protein